jgi:DNA-binding winged helix-turn-helix (wHTH) protein/TolB-like protein
MDPQQGPVFVFGPFRLETAERRLLRDREVVPLTPKAFDLLLKLVQRSGHAVSKDELLNELWPDTFVEEGTLTRTVSRLREALGEGESEGRYIETVAKYGYRFVAPVEPIELAFEEFVFARRTAARIRIGQEAAPAEQAAKGEAGAAREVQRLEPARHWRRVALASAVILTILGAIAYFTAGRQHQTIDSIAVLPFVNETGDPNAEYLSDGLTEGVINSLSQLSRLRVVPRPTVFRYKEREEDPQALARTLEVRALLTGRMVRRGQTLDLQAELIDVRRMSQLWGKKYHLTPLDAQAIQGDISTAVSQQLGLGLTGEEQQRLTIHQTANPRAYEAYLKGRYLYQQFTPDSLNKALTHFTDALRIDPNYAAAHAGVARVYTELSGLSLPPSEAMPKAKDAILKALALDDSLAEAHLSLAFIQWWGDWDFPGAERAFRRAMELDPKGPEGYREYGHFLSRMGRNDQAIAVLGRSIELDPLSVPGGADLAFAYLYARRYDQAIEQAQETLELDSHHEPTRRALVRAYLLKGLTDQAIAELEKIRDTSDVTSTALRGYAYALAGRREEALDILKKLQRLSAERYVRSYEIALIYVGLGMNEQALQWLRTAYEDRSDRLTALNVDPAWDPLRTDPRFVDLVRRVGLTD